jgi:cyclopropane-fatty-acyl-phospholipid synthase
MQVHTAGARGSAGSRGAGRAAASIAPVVTAAFGGPPPVRIECWDGSTIAARSDGTSVAGCVRLQSTRALRRVVWAPSELGLARAYVSGDLDVDGDLPTVLAALEHASVAKRLRVDEIAAGLKAAAAAHALGLPPTTPPEEARLHGRRHSKRRDASAISHHYDVGNDFYRLMLGEAMTYSCARWGGEATTLEVAQAAKHELICRKLGLTARPGMRLLDVGCGWASMAMHAAAHHGARVVGVTISEEQCALAQRRVKEAHLEDEIEIRLQDYRDVDDGPFDAISSIGMFEHVGRERVGEYFDDLRALLRPHGRLLNHAISSIGGSRVSTRSFIGRYVFPDSELLDVADTIAAMERAGFEVRDVESLREHYALTLRAWIANLEAGWREAVHEVGERRARVWRLYMAGSVVGFEDGGLGIHQVLGVVPDRSGASAVPLHREW